MIVLDSSAVLAIALNEPGATNVLAAMPEAILSAANLAEILTVAERKGMDSDIIYQDIVSLGVTIVPVETIHAREAAKLWLTGPGLNLSLGDRLCLALAIEHSAEVMTSDREMTKINAGVSVNLFR